VFIHTVKPNISQKSPMLSLKGLYIFEVRLELSKESYNMSQELCQKTPITCQKSPITCHKNPMIIYIFEVRPERDLYGLHDSFACVP